MNEKVVMHGFYWGILVLLLVPIVLAHTEETISNKALTNTVLVLLGIAAGNAFLLIFLSRKAKHKTIFFLGIIIPIIGATLFLVGVTIFTNLSAVTKGPVHWHADYEIWACGEKVELVNPSGISNKIGTSLFHEHNDNRIHIEGVVEDLHEVNLQHFFEVVGGEFTGSGVTLITEEGKVSYENGEICNGILQVFLYTIDEGEVTQEKLHDFVIHVPSPYSEVPPGDCLVIEFGEEKETTERICETYEIALEKGEIRYGS